MIKSKEYLRFRWSHDHFIHRALVIIFNTIMRIIPFNFKYAIGQYTRRNSPPYNLITPGSIVVQVGAPSDTLMSGRSRAAYFCRFAGETGKVLIVEPDMECIRIFQETARKYQITNVVFAPSALWSEKKTLIIQINSKHPASNFIDGTKNMSVEDLARYTRLEIPANTLDNILAENKIGNPLLVSITTNGSEKEILQGMLESISTGLHFIALARTGNYSDLMVALGYELYTYDDRGATYVQKNRLSLDELRRVF